MTVSINTRPIIIEVRICPAASGCSAMLFAAFATECAMPSTPPKHATPMSAATAQILRSLTVFPFAPASADSSTSLSVSGVSTFRSPPAAASAGIVSAHSSASTANSDQIRFIIRLLNAKMQFLCEIFIKTIYHPCADGKSFYKKHKK